MFTIPERFLGFEELATELHRFSDNSTFPKSNIIKEGVHYTVELALSGYTKKDINVSLDKRSHTLTVSSNGVNRNETKFQVKGISSKKFNTSFRGGEYINLESASFENGLLVIQLKTEVPEDVLQSIDIK